MTTRALKETLINPLPVMLRMYIVSVVYNLSDRACQDERDGSASVGSFVGLGERGARVSRGTIVDATFVEAPSSTKNASGSRDPEARQGKKGNAWHFELYRFFGHRQER